MSATVGFQTIVLSELVENAKSFVMDKLPPLERQRTAQLRPEDASNLR